MRTILITGATGAIGSALAMCYANRNTRLILTGRNPVKLDAITKRCEQKGALVIAEALDITEQKSFIQWVTAISERFPVDMVIANAGINTKMANTDSSESFATTKKVFDTNLYGVIATITPLINQMKQSKNGQIVIISSLAAYLGLPHSAAYCASKAAVKVYGESLRSHLAMYNIKVNVIYPGFVKSAMTESVSGPKPFMMSADKAAKIIKRGLAKNKGIIAFPKTLSFSTRLVSLLPAGLRNLLLRRVETMRE